MSEIRTTSSTGGQKAVKPERHDLIPRRAMAWVARVFGFGATKYADHNWRRGYEWGKSIASLQRHIDEFVEGNTYDEESGLPHMAHAAFHCLALLTWLEEQGEGADNAFDDRWMHSMERARRLLQPDEELEEEPLPVNEPVYEIIQGVPAEFDPIGWPTTPPTLHIHTIDEKARRVQDIKDSINYLNNSFNPGIENLRF